MKLGDDSGRSSLGPLPCAESFSEILSTLLRQGLSKIRDNSGPKVNYNTFITRRATFGQRSRKIAGFYGGRGGPYLRKGFKNFASVLEELSTHRCGISDPFARRSRKHFPITRRMGTAHICRIHDAKKHRQQQSVMQVKVMQVSASFQPRVAPPLTSLDNTCCTQNLKETEGDKQSFSWPTQHQGTELPLPLIQWAR